MISPLTHTARHTMRWPLTAAPLLAAVALIRASLDSAAERRRRGQPVAYGDAHHRARARSLAPPGAPAEGDGYETIGQFYAAIEQGLRHLCDRLGEREVFCGDQDVFHPERDEVAHYYRFQELELGRRYRRGDTFDYVLPETRS